MKTLIIKPRWIRETAARPKRLLTENDQARVIAYLNAYHAVYPITELVSRGTNSDAEFAEWAMANGLAITHFHARHDHQMAARNKDMVKYVDNALIFTDGHARRPEAVIHAMLETKKPCLVFNIFNLTDNPQF